MSEYEFRLTVGLPAAESDPDSLVELLGANGCDDAIIGMGRRGRLALEFSREAGSATQALLGAIADVRRAIPDANLLEASPDLVGVTDVAGLLHVSRQNVRKLLLASDTPSPPPVHEGRSPMWRLTKVLQWLREEKGYAISSDLLDLASVTMQVNIAVEVRDADPRAQRAIGGILAGTARSGGATGRAAAVQSGGPGRGA